MEPRGFNQRFISIKECLRLLPWRLLASILFILFPTSASASEHNILLILSSDSPVYKTISKHLLSLNHNDNIKAKITKISLGEDDGQQLDITKLNNQDLIVAVGSKATQAVANTQTSNIPVLSTLIPQHTYKNIIEKSKHNLISAIFVDQPIERQLALTKIILPNARSFGVLSGYQSDDNISDVRKKLNQASFKHTFINIKTQKQAANAIKQLLRTSDVIVTLPSQITQQPLTAKWLLYMSYQRDVSVIGFSRGYIKAGALASVFSTPEQIAQQTQEWLTRWITRPEQTKHASTESPKYYSVKFNRPVGDSLGISIADEQVVIDKMKIMLGEMQ